MDIICCDGSPSQGVRLRGNHVYSSLMTSLWCNTLPGSLGSTVAKSSPMKAAENAPPQPHTHSRIGENAHPTEQASRKEHDEVKDQTCCRVAMVVVAVFAGVSFAATRIPFLDV